MARIAVPLALIILASVAHAQSERPNSGEDSYAIGAYSAGMTETVYVYGPLPTHCDAARLDAIRAVQQSITPPSQKEIGYRCATRDQIARLNLNPPICEIVNGDTYSNGGSGWAYVCYRGIVDRFVNPSRPEAKNAPLATVVQTAPQFTAEELEERRKAQERAEEAQRAAAELVAKRTAERMEWQRRAVDWKYQRDRAICAQKINAHRLPGQDDPGPLCDRAARNSSANPAVDIMQYCAYLRSTSQPESTIHAACDTTP